MRRVLPVFMGLTFVCCRASDTAELADLPGGGQAISLLGDTLYPTPAAPEVLLRQQEQLAEAMATHESDPLDADALIWVGRRQAYLGDYRPAIRTFTQGIEMHPDDARMYRHRGHRYITLRMFDEAIADFQRAVELTTGKQDEVEPDGQPNPLNIPTSTLQFNIWYHLGLAHYLRGDFAKALDAYEQCMAVSGNPDAQVATSHWMYMTLRRLGRDGEAAAVLDPIDAEMEIIENDAYHQLLLMYKGEVSADSLLGPEEDAVQSATVAYGVGNWYYYNGDETQAMEIFRNILAGQGWAAFGYIAAEADLARLR